MCETTPSALLSPGTAVPIQAACTVRTHVGDDQAADCYRPTMFRSSGGTISAKMGLLQAGAAAAMHRPMRNRTTAYRAVAPTDVPSNGRPCNHGPRPEAPYTHQLCKGQVQSTRGAQHCQVILQASCSALLDSALQSLLRVITRPQQKLLAWQCTLNSKTENGTPANTLAWHTMMRPCFDHLCAMPAPAH